MNNQNQQQAADRIKQANSVLVTVSTNPSVDQLAACIGLTLALNKMGKHATAVFSGMVPSTIEFLQPEKTIEKTTDSLRDFIIAIDKSRADKLRYKVEDTVVKIFITPYRTSITEKDLQFSQGDFNVDVVVALGVHNQADLDQAITSHGRILHDATVVTVNVQPGGELGSVNWLEPNASSLSELVTQLLTTLDKKLIDSQIATALLTGIVAATNRFSNTQTFPQTMSVSAELMAAGANQQLVAAKLEEPVPIPAVEETKPAPEAPPASPTPAPEAAAPEPTNDGTLDIPHEGAPAEQPPGNEPAPPEAMPGESQPQEIHIDEHGVLQTPEDGQAVQPSGSEPPVKRTEPPKFMVEPPTMGGSGNPDPTTPPAEDEMGIQPNAEDEEKPSGGATAAGSFIVGDNPMPLPSSSSSDQHEPATPNDTLTQIEEKVHSPHLGQDTAPTAPPTLPGPNPFIPPADNTTAPIVEPDQQAPSVDSARSAVAQAINAVPAPTLEPIQALNAQPVDLLKSVPTEPPVVETTDWSTPGFQPQVVVGGTPLDSAQPSPYVQPGAVQQAPQTYDPNAPPPVPPPMMPPTM